MNEMKNVQSLGYIPPQMSNPYIKIKGSHVIVYQNHFQVDNQILTLISPLVIEYSQRGNLNNKLVIQMFDSKVKPLKPFSDRLILTIDQMKQLFCFNLFLFGDLFRTNCANEISRSTRSFESIFMPNNQQNIFVAPSDMNFTLITKFINFKLNLDLEDYEEGKLACKSPFNILTINKIYHDPDMPAKQFLNDLVDQGSFPNIQEALDHYDINALTLSFKEFLLEFKVSGVNIQKFRKEALNQWQPIAMTSPTLHINQIHDYPQSDHANSKCSKCSTSEKCSITDGSCKNPAFYYLSELRAYPLQLDFVDMVARIYLQLICELKLICYTQLIAKRLLKTADLEKIEEAISTPSYSMQRNYDNLEVLGDSVLKYLVSAFIYVEEPPQGESEMTKNRTVLIKNKALASLMKVQQFYILNDKYHYKRVRNPMSIVQNDDIDTPLSDGQLADIFESLAGAVYYKRFKFSDFILYLRMMDFPIPLLQLNSLYTSLHHTKLQTGSPLIKTFTGDNFTYYPFFDHLKLNQFQMKVNWNRPLSDFYFEAADLKNAFTFTDQTYERLEFLGDAALELLVIANIYKLAEQKYYNLNRQQLVRDGVLKQEDLLCPGMLHSAKIILLDNGFMSIMAIYHRFHEFAIGMTQEQQTQIEAVLIQLCEEDFKDFKKIQEYANKIPKFMGDLWESVAAALLKEKGWEGLVDIYGKWYGPYIQYVFQNLLQIYDHYQCKNKELQSRKK